VIFTPWTRRYRKRHSTPFHKNSLNWIRYNVLVNNSERALEQLAQLVNNADLSLRKKHYNVVMDHMEFDKKDLDACIHIFDTYWHLWDLDERDMARMTRLKNWRLSYFIGLPFSLPIADEAMELVSDADARDMLQLIPLNKSGLSLPKVPGTLKLQPIRFFVDGANVLSCLGFANGLGWAHSQTYAELLHFCDHVLASHGPYLLVFTEFHAKKHHFRFLKTPNVCVVPMDDDNHLFALAAEYNQYIVSNDRFKNHIFRDKTNRLRNWLPEHVLRFDPDSKELLTLPCTVSRRVQFGTDGCYYIPTESGDWVKVSTQPDRIDLGEL
jgi:hypothetical protein